MTNPQSNSDRNQVIYAQIIARTWSDEAYKAQLLANPKQTLTEAGMLLPESGTIQVLEDTEAVHYVVLPEERTFADFKDDLATGLAPLFPLSADQEIIIRQVTENVKYFVLPRKPEAPEVERNVTSPIIAGDVTAANTNVVANAEAVANAVAANNAAAATNVAGAAEVVAVIGIVLI